ncbi:MAG: ABC transporter substrate-binding protein [Planctomycetaceae bacterium]|jgi:1,4-dihydroxy-6-naphthoate synthase|nr:ABC transporter substrate-binding protein [Planctomycetaceae bacterium]
MTEKLQIRIGHSPDSDDAFMFYALATDKIVSDKYEFSHELLDIDTLNYRAFNSEFDLTAMSVHAYAYLADKYLFCKSGASMGENYGPVLIENGNWDYRHQDTPARVAIPGELTSAFLALKLYFAETKRTNIEFINVPFDKVVDSIKSGETEAGLLIHEGQLTYTREGLRLIVDLGVWWMQETELPLPLGANGIKKDLPSNVINDVTKLLNESIQYALDFREDALNYALKFGRGLEYYDVDQFVGMYVNNRTLDLGGDGQKSIREFLKRAYNNGIIPNLIEPEFV